MKFSSFRAFHTLVFLLIASAAALVSQLSAQTSHFWSGNGTTNDWTNAGNFRNAASGTTNLVPSSSDQTQLVFGSRAATRTTANNTTAGFNVSAITFNSATDEANTSFTITGSEVEMKKSPAAGNPPPSITQNSAIGHSINVPLKLAEPLTLGGDGAGLITFGGTTAWTSTNKNMVKNGTSAYLFNVNASGAGSITVNGGTVALPTNGSANLGNILLQGGVVASNGTFGRALGTAANQIRFAGANGGGFAAFGGALTVSTNLGTWGTTGSSLTAAGPLILGSRIADNVVTLSSALALGTAARTINLVDNANSANDWSAISGIISGAGGGLTITGTGRLILSNTNTFTGVTSINGGTLSVGTINDGGVAGNLGQAAVTASNLVLGGGTLQYTGATASTNRNFTLTAATSSSIEVTQAATVLTMSGANTNTTGQLTKTGAGTLIFSGNHLSTGGFTLAAGTLRATTSAGALGAGVLTLSGGVLELANNSGLSFGRNTTVNGNTTILSDRLAAGTGVNHTLGTLSLGAQTLTVGAGTNVNSGTAEVTFGNTTVTGAGSILANSGSRINFSGTMGGDFLKTLGGAGDLIASGAISGAAGLTKTGAGTLTLSGANSFTGQLTVANGTLSIASINNASANGTLGNSANAVLLGSNGTTGTLEYTGATAATTKPFSAVAGGTAALNVTNADTTLTYSAQLGGSGSITLGGAGNHIVSGGIGGTVGTFTKNGAGALTLNGQGHGAGFAINQGRVNVNIASAFGNSTNLTLASGVTLDNTSASAVTVNNAGLNKTLGSTLNFTGTQALSLGTGLTTLTANTTFDVTASTLTLAGNVTGSFGIIKNGAGTLVLSGLTTGSFAGNSEVNAGELFLDGTSVLAGTAANTITLNTGGTLRIGATGGTGSVTVVNNGGTLITTGIQNSNQVFAANTTLAADNANFNGVQRIGAGVTISAASDLFGTTPGSATSDRIVMENGATMRSTNAININANKGINLSGSSATFDTGSGSIFINSQVTGTGRLIKTGNQGFRILNQSNSYSGGTEIRGGTFGIYGDGSLGAAGTEVVIDGATLNSGQGTGGQTITIGSDRSIQIAKGKNNNLDATNGSTLAYNGIISEFGASGTANLQINTAGSREGRVVLGGTNTYTGATNVNAGTLEITGSGSINNSSAINVAAGASFIYNSSTALAVAPVLNGSESNRARFTGSGTINAAMSLDSLGDALSPGNSPGIQAYGENQTWESFTYEWELNDWVASVAGTNIDFIQINGSLLLSGDSYAIDILSLDKLNIAGPVGANGGDTFAETSRSWTILSATGGITGFSAQNWVLNTTGFANEFEGGWSLASTGNDLVLSYTPIPEPRAALLGGIGILLLLLRRRR